jgi:death on curing protein
MSTPPPDDVQYLDLADYLWLAGAALDRAPEAVFDVADPGLAESALHAPAATYGGVEFYPDLVTKAQVLLVHLTKNHPLPDGNKRAAYLAMIEFLARNGRRFVATDVDATIDMMVKIAGSEV